MICAIRKGGKRSKIRDKVEALLEEIYVHSGRSGMFIVLSPFIVRAVRRSGIEVESLFNIISAPPNGAEEDGESGSINMSHLTV